MGEFGRIDLNSKKPYYLQVKDLIQTGIEHGEFKSEEKLPSEIELCRELKVSRTVIRQALTELEQLGLIHKRKGKGSFVSNNITVLAASIFLPDFLWEKQADIENISIELVAKEIYPANFQEALVLKINAGDPVLKIQRVYIHNEEPVILSQSLLPERTFKHLAEEDMLYTTRYLDNIPAPVRFDHADHFLELAYAAKPESVLLHISNGMPLIKVTTFSFNKDNTPIAADTNWMRGDRIRLRGTIYKQSERNHG